MPKSNSKLQQKINNISKRPLPKVFFLVLIAFSILYMIFVLPKTVDFLNTNLSIYARNFDDRKANMLDPIVSASTIQATYSLASLFDEVPMENITSNTSYATVDSRIIAMKKFLTDYNSPMSPYAETFISEADEYGLDWRLVASISGVESAFGNLIPSNSNNAWGWRGGENGAYSIFTSWNDGIKTITRGLATGYGTDLTPFDIEPSYCPPCYANPAHSWANGVTNFMNELQYYLDNLDSI
jgi:hypothetical protein